jgi:hypothetical protein
MKVHAGRKNSVISGGCVEHLGKSIRVDAVDFDSERPTTGHLEWFREPTASRRTHLLKEADSSASVRTDLVHPGLLTIKFLDNDKGKHDFVLIKLRQ